MAEGRGFFGIFGKKKDTKTKTAPDSSPDADSGPIDDTVTPNNDGDIRTDEERAIDRELEDKLQRTKKQLVGKTAEITPEERAALIEIRNKQLKRIEALSADAELLSTIIEKKIGSRWFKWFARAQIYGAAAPLTYGIRMLLMAVLSKHPELGALAVPVAAGAGFVGGALVQAGKEYLTVKDQKKDALAWIREAGISENVDEMDDATLQRNFKLLIKMSHEERIDKDRSSILELQRLLSLTRREYERRLRQRLASAFIFEGMSAAEQATSRLEVEKKIAYQMRQIIFETPSAYVAEYEAIAKKLGKFKLADLTALIAAKHRIILAGSIVSITAGYAESSGALGHVDHALHVGTADTGAGHHGGDVATHEGNTVNAGMLGGISSSPTNHEGTAPTVPNLHTTPDQLMPAGHTPMTPLLHPASDPSVPAVGHTPTDPNTHLAASTSPEQVPAALVSDEKAENLQHDQNMNVVAIESKHDELINEAAGLPHDLPHGDHVVLHHTDAQGNTLPGPEHEDTVRSNLEIDISDPTRYSHYSHIINDNENIITHHSNEPAGEHQWDTRGFTEDDQKTFLQLAQDDPKLAIQWADQHNIDARPLFDTDTDGNFTNIKHDFLVLNESDQHAVLSHTEMADQEIGAREGHPIAQTSPTSGTATTPGSNPTGAAQGATGSTPVPPDTTNSNQPSSVPHPPSSPPAAHQTPIHGAGHHGHLTPPQAAGTNTTGTPTVVPPVSADNGHIGQTPQIGGDHPGTTQPAAGDQHSSTGGENHGTSNEPAAKDPFAGPKTETSTNTTPGSNENSGTTDSTSNPTDSGSTNHDTSQHSSTQDTTGTGSTPPAGTDQGHSGDSQSSGTAGATTPAPAGETPPTQGADQPPVASPPPAPTPPVTHPGIPQPPVPSTPPSNVSPSVDHTAPHSTSFWNNPVVEVGAPVLGLGAIVGAGALTKKYIDNKRRENEAKEKEALDKIMGKRVQVAINLKGRFHFLTFSDQIKLTYPALKTQYFINPKTGQILPNTDRPFKVIITDYSVDPTTLSVEIQPLDDLNGYIPQGEMYKTSNAVGQIFEKVKNASTATPPVSQPVAIRNALGEVWYIESCDASDDTVTMANRDDPTKTQPGMHRQQLGYIAIDWYIKDDGKGDEDDGYDEDDEKIRQALEKIKNKPVEASIYIDGDFDDYRLEVDNVDPDLIDCWVNIVPKLGQHLPNNKDCKFTIRLTDYSENEELDNLEVDIEPAEILGYEPHGEIYKDDKAVDKILQVANTCNGAKPISRPVALRDDQGVIWFVDGYAPFFGEITLVTDADSTGMPGTKKVESNQIAGKFIDWYVKDGIPIVDTKPTIIPSTPDLPVNPPSPDADPAKPETERRRNEILRQLKAIFERAGERTEEEVQALIQEYSDLIAKEKDRGEGKLKDTIGEMKGSESFVDRNVAYIQGDCEAIFIGDTHGDPDAVRAIIGQSDFVGKVARGEKIKLVFLGDYCDRGDGDLENIEQILDLKIKFPDNVVILRGNHEEESVSGNAFNGSKFFLASLRAKYPGERGKKLFDEYMAMFENLPNCVVTENGIVALHGGIGEFTSLQDLQSNELNIRWNDPAGEGSSLSGLSPSRRGGGAMFFGQDVLDRFLASVGGKALIRAHEYGRTPVIQWNGTIATIFSNGRGGTKTGYGQYDANYLDVDLGLELPKLDESQHLRTLDYANGARLMEMVNGVSEVDDNLPVLPQPPLVPPISSPPKAPVIPALPPVVDREDGGRDNDGSDAFESEEDKRERELQEAVESLIDKPARVRFSRAIGRGVSQEIIDFEDGVVPDALSSKGWPVVAKPGQVIPNQSETTSFLFNIMITKSTDAGFEFDILPEEISGYVPRYEIRSDSGAIDTIFKIARSITTQDTESPVLFRDQNGSTWAVTGATSNGRITTKVVDNHSDDMTTTSKTWTKVALKKAIDWYTRNDLDINTPPVVPQVDPVQPPPPRHPSDEDDSESPPELPRPSIDERASDEDDSESPPELPRPSIDERGGGPELNEAEKLERKNKGKSVADRIDAIKNNAENQSDAERAGQLRQLVKDEFELISSEPKLAKKAFNCAYDIDDLETTEHIASQCDEFMKPNSINYKLADLSLDVGDLVRAARYYQQLDPTDSEEMQHKFEICVRLAALLPEEGRASYVDYIRSIDLRENKIWEELYDDEVDGLITIKEEAVLSDYINILKQQIISLKTSSYKFYNACESLVYIYAKAGYPTVSQYYLGIYNSIGGKRWSKYDLEIPNDCPAEKVIDLDTDLAERPAVDERSSDEVAEQKAQRVAVEESIDAIYNSNEELAERVRQLQELVRDKFDIISKSSKLAQSAVHCACRIDDIETAERVSSRWDVTEKPKSVVRALFIISMKINDSQRAINYYEQFDVNSKDKMMASFALVSKLPENQQAPYLDFIRNRDLSEKGEWKDLIDDDLVDGLIDIKESAILDNWINILKQKTISSKVSSRSFFIAYQKLVYIYAKAGYRKIAQYYIDESKSKWEAAGMNLDEISVPDDCPSDQIITLDTSVDTSHPSIDPEGDGGGAGAGGGGAEGDDLSELATSSDSPAVASLPSDVESDQGGAAVPPTGPPIVPEPPVAKTGGEEKREMTAEESVQALEAVGIKIKSRVICLIDGKPSEGWTVASIGADAVTLTRTLSPAQIVSVAEIIRLNPAAATKPEASLPVSSEFRVPLGTDVIPPMPEPTVQPAAPALDSDPKPENINDVYEMDPGKGAEVPLELQEFDRNLIKMKQEVQALDSDQAKESWIRVNIENGNIDKFVLKGVSKILLFNQFDPEIARKQNGKITVIQHELLMTLKSKGIDFQYPLKKSEFDEETMEIRGHGITFLNTDSNPALDNKVSFVREPGIFLNGRIIRKSNVVKYQYIGVKEADRADNSGNRQEVIPVDKQIQLQELYQRLEDFKGQVEEITPENMIKIFSKIESIVDDIEFEEFSDAFFLDQSEEEIVRNQVLSDKIAAIQFELLEILKTKGVDLLRPLVGAGFDLNTMESNEKTNIWSETKPELNNKVVTVLHNGIVIDGKVVRKSGVVKWVYLDPNQRVV